uniref:DNA replication licensing factor MCM4 n=1 Tax=Ciona savignyi TaxID=51511 RepID=H2ZKX3_CIOSA
PATSPTQHVGLLDATTDSILAPQTPANLSEIDLSSPLFYGTPSSVRTPRSSGLTPGRTGRGTMTPVRQRADLGSNNRVRVVNLNSDQNPDQSRPEPIPEENEDEIPSSADPAGQLVIWGTDVVVSHCKTHFTHIYPDHQNVLAKCYICLGFPWSMIKINCFHEFLPTEEDVAMETDGMDANEPMYLRKLEEISVTEEPFFEVNCSHLKAFDADLYRQLICYPQEVIPTFDMAVNEMFFTRYPDISLMHQIQVVKPFNAERTKNMRNLNPEDIDQLITINGMVIQSSSLIPEMREGFFRCNVCHHEVTVEIERGRIAEPSICDRCKTTHAMSLIHNRSLFTDRQMIKLQEAPDDMPAGQTPHSVALHCYGHLVDSVQPGDRVVVTGIYRAQPLRANPRMSNVKSVYRTHVDVLNFRKQDEKRQKLYETADDEDSQVKHEFFCTKPFTSKLINAEKHFMSWGQICCRLFQPQIQLTKARVEMIHSLSKKPDIYDRLAQAVAPSQLKKYSKTGSKAGMRAEMHVLLCGDPGTSKSQLLRYVHEKLSPRGQYTNGKCGRPHSLYNKGSRNETVDDATRCSLMEQQTLSIAKAGIICQLNARTSVMAAANPCESQWNPKKTIRTVMLPHTLLSRFDLIFLMLDPQDEAYDRRLANHLVSLYHRTQEEEEVDVMDADVLKDYIAYARAFIKPRLTEDAGQELVQRNLPHICGCNWGENVKIQQPAYVEMRKGGGSGSKGGVTAYPRQLESLIRLSEAHAKSRLSVKVERLDVQEALRLYREALKQSATDPRTGIVDISILTTGMSATARKRQEELKGALKQLIDQDKGRGGQGTKTGPTMRCRSLLDRWRSQTDQIITQAMFDEAVRALQDDEVLVRTGDVIRLC